MQKIDNRSLCRLLNLHLPSFFDNIYIPFVLFKEDEWNIKKIIRENKDVIFFNDIYIEKNTKKKFIPVFNKYVDMINRIMNADNCLYIFLNRWTDTSNTRWKCVQTNSHINIILSNPKYEYISPIYITNLYYEYSKKYNKNFDICKQNIEKHMDDITNKLEYETDIFVADCDHIIDTYVYTYPITNCVYLHSELNTYTKSMINKLLIKIISFTDKLINMNIYAIHTIINDAISMYVPLDHFNTFESEYHNNTSIIII